MSAVLPQLYTEDDVVYVVSVLRSAPPSCTRGSQCLETLLGQNEKIIGVATSPPINQKVRGERATRPRVAASHFAPETHEVSKVTHAEEDKVVERKWHIKDTKDGMGAKQYLPYWKNESEWKNHFGDRWDRFKELKNTFDPLNVLTPGQRIFTRKSIVN